MSYEVHTDELDHASALLLTLRDEELASILRRLEQLEYELPQALGTGPSERALASRIEECRASVQEQDQVLADLGETLGLIASAYAQADERAGDYVRSVSGDDVAFGVRGSPAALEGREAFRAAYDPRIDYEASETARRVFKSAVKPL